MCRFIRTKNKTFKMRFAYILGLLLISISSVSAFNFPSDEVTINTYTGNSTNLSQMQDTNIPSPNDNQVLSWDDATGMWIAEDASAVGDTNETTRFNTLTETNCGAGEYAYGVDATGLVECRADTTDGNESWNKTYADTLYADISITGDNSSWNETYADTLYAATGSGNSSWNQTLADTLYIEVGEEGNLNVNSSDYWDNIGTINATQMEDNGGTLNILVTWLSTVIDNWLSGKDTDDLTEGSTNLYDNQSWNETYATTLYADIGVTGDNSSWNETLATSLYADISLTDTNASTACATTEVLLGNDSCLDSDDFYDGADNDSWNETLASTLYAPKAISLPATNITTGTFGTGNYIMDGNLTVEKLVFENDASHYLEDNSTCIKIYGDTSILEIC